MQQYMISSSDISNNIIRLSKDDLHHIYRVMRCSIGDLIECVDFQTQTRYLATIIDLDGTIEIKEVIAINNELEYNITLAFGLVKSDKLEFVIQKACELGVSKFIPLKVENSIVKYDDKKLVKKVERWHKIIKEACEQAKRNTIMKISKPLTLSELIAEKQTVNLVAYEKADVSKKMRNLIKKPCDILIVVGPEGGFEYKEITYLKDNEFEDISLGKRILRCETAAITTLSVICDILE